jgi:DNA-directed RNA polymerase specialized sigma24 family protein
MPRQSPFPISLTEEDKDALERLVRTYTSPYRDVIRAKIVLYAAQGLENDAIAQRLDTPRQIVSKWRKRFFEMGRAGLEELPRQGRPGVFSPRYRRRRKGPRL